MTTEEEPREAGLDRDIVDRRQPLDVVATQVGEALKLEADGEVVRRDLEGTVVFMLDRQSHHIHVTISRTYRKEIDR